MLVFTRDRFYVQTGKEAYNISVRDGNLTIQQVIWTTFNLPIDTPLVWVVKKRMGEGIFLQPPPTAPCQHSSPFTMVTEARKQNKLGA